MRLALLSLIALLALPASASAAWFPGEAIDGPGADVVALGDVDLAREGTGGVVYLKRDGGETHVFLSRIVDGAFRAPERVDAGIPGKATAASLSAGDGHQLVIAFVTGGKLYGAFTPEGPSPAPLGAPQLLADGTPAAPIASPHADVGINGTAYVVHAARGDVGAHRLADGAWEAIPAPLDVDPPRSAGNGSSRPRVAVSAEGNAVATWGEDHSDGRRRVYGRRLTGLTPSTVPQDLTLPELAGAGAGGPADSPDVDIEDDGSYAWVVLRQDFGGTSRTFARRLVGSTFEAATAIDAGQPSSAPRFDMNGRGIGATAVAGPSGSVIGGLLDVADTLLGFARVDTAGSEADPAPAVATSERRTVAQVYRQQIGGVSRIVGRQKPDDERKTGRPVIPYEAETVISPAEFGGEVGPPEVSGNNNGDFAAAWVQGPPTARRLVVSVWDKPPGLPVGRSSSNFQRRRNAVLKWGAGRDLWGAQTFRVLVDGAEVASTAREEATVARRLPDGPHRWQILSTDRRGQTVRSRTRTFRVDTSAPRVRVRVTGVRRARRTLKVLVGVQEGRGSGVSRITVDYGDRSPTSALASSSHRYRRGTFTLRVRVSDKAGNVTRRTLRLRIRR